jgi:hypothetical protein
MKTRGLIGILLIAALVFVVYSVNKSVRFAPAEDLPREALVYVQVADLPKFIKLWNESKFREKSLFSACYQDFTKRHLGLKLESRWEEFSEASGFPLDLETIAGLANNQAAMAIYDIGKLDFVFIAPVSDEVFAATKFMKNQDKFTEETLEDGTKIYRAAVDADRGRQRQELIFTNSKGRFILATSEKLLAQTLNNINDNKNKNRLIDEPLFKSLSEKIEPHSATVWVKQSILNDNYYFKRYWLMSDAKDLKNIRAGIFDIEIGEKNLIERRKFLIAESVNSSTIENSQLQKLLTFVPENIPFYRLQRANQNNINNAVKKVIFDRSAENKEVSDSNYSRYSYEDDGFLSDNFSSLNENFDSNIDEVEENESIEERAENINFSQFLRSANPQAVLTFTQPKALPAPKFVEFQRAAIFHFSAPKTFNITNFEAAIMRNISARILVSLPNAQLNWETKNENDSIWRELNLPMLGWNVSYAMRGNELILTNNGDFLQEILSLKNSTQNTESQTPFSELTVVNLTQKENAYNKVFAELAKKSAADKFFVNDVAGLLDSINEIKKIEIRRNYSQSFLDEELTASFGD